MLSARLPSLRRAVDLHDARERIKSIKTGAAFGPDATRYAKRVVELTQAQPQPFSNDELGLRQGQSVDDLLAEALAARREQNYAPGPKLRSPSSTSLALKATSGSSAP